MDIDEFIDYLKRKAAEQGTQRQYAESLGVSEAYLSDVLNGRREPGQCRGGSAAAGVCHEALADER